MDEVLARYFAAEKSESLRFIAIGVIAIAISIWLLIIRNPYRAAAWPLIAIALIQIVVGSTVYSRTDKQVADLHVTLARGEKAAEISRMMTVMRAFVMYRWIEIAACDCRRHHGVRGEIQRRIAQRGHRSRRTGVPDVAGRLHRREARRGLPGSASKIRLAP